MDINSLLTLPNALGLFALVNLWTFILFGLDKIRAEAGSWRESEGTLLAWAFFLGGHRRVCRSRCIPAQDPQAALFQPPPPDRDTARLCRGAGGGLDAGVNAIVVHVMPPSPPARFVRHLSA